MKLLDCPACKARIRPADVNVRRDTAYCGACSHLFRLSDFGDTHDATRYGPELAAAMRPVVRGIAVAPKADGGVTITARPRTSPVG